MADRIYSTDYCITGSGGMVYRCKTTDQGKDIFQSCDLSSEPDHGKCIRNAVLRPVLCERSGKWIAEIYGCDTYTDPVPVNGCGNERSGRTDELPDVVR